MKFNVCPGHPNLSIGPVWPVAPDRCAGYLDHFFAPGRAGRAGTELDAGA
jgi:hypothetical protein